MKIEEIWIYPIKSLSGVCLQKTLLHKNGALVNDRRWAFFTLNGQICNGKKFKKLHQLETRYLLGQEKISINNDFFSMQNLPPLEHYIGGILAEKINVKENIQGGFPDDTQFSGPTLVSIESLKSLGTSLQISYHEMKKRFRPNIIISGISAFEEDTWIGKTLTIMQHQFALLNHSNRCLVPTFNLETGQIDVHFIARFSEIRKSTLPEIAIPFFKHYYKLAINTQIKNWNGTAEIKVGDTFTIE